MALKKTMAIIGNGAIANHIIDVYNRGLLENYELVAILGRTETKTAAAAKKGGCRACSTIEELLETKPWIVVEAASVQAVKDHALTIINAGSHFAVLSIGGLADDTFRKKVEEACRKNDVKAYLSAGCVGGLDALRTISLMGASQAEISVMQNAEDIRGTALFTESLISEGVDKCIFKGTADEAIKMMPTQINIGIAVGLASVGTKNTKVIMNTTVKDERDVANITINAGKAFANIEVGSCPEAQIAGWGMVATLRNITSGITFA